MSSFPWLTTFGLVPLVGAVAVALLPRGRELLAKQVTLGVSLVALGVAVLMATQFHADGPQFQLVERHPWIPQFGVSYAVGVDGI